MSRRGQFPRGTRSIVCSWFLESQMPSKRGQFPRGASSTVFRWFSQRASRCRFWQLARGVRSMVVISLFVSLMERVSASSSMVSCVPSVFL